MASADSALIGALIVALSGSGTPAALIAPSFSLLTVIAAAPGSGDAASNLSNGIPPVGFASVWQTAQSGSQHRRSANRATYGPFQYALRPA